MEKNELEWIVAAQKGDDDSFSRLVQAYQVPVYNLCYRMLGEAKDAEDAAQETFIRAYKAIKKYDINRKFSTWILSIASNYCIDQYRRKRVPTFSYDSLPQPNIRDDAPNIEHKFSMNEEQEQVQKLLKKLKPKDRSAVIMRYWYDYSYEEIASSLSLTVSAVKSRLHRSRKDLAVSWTAMQPKVKAVERTQHGTPTI